MRYRLRTLLILMLVVGPLAGCGDRGWFAADWQAYTAAMADVTERRAELALAMAGGIGSKGALAGIRHSELRLRREDALARKRSAIYRLIAPKP